MWLIQNRESERQAVVCRCCFPPADLCVHVWMSVYVSACWSVTETLPHSRWLLGLRKHILWITDLTNIRYVPQITWICLCPWCWVQNYQLFLKWHGLIASYPGLCLCVFVCHSPHCPTAPHFKITLKPKTCSLALSSLIQYLTILTMIFIIDSSVDTFLNLIDNL